MFDLNEAIDRNNYLGGWRPGQRETVRKVLDELNSGTQIIELMAPTAAGKTLMFYVIGRTAIEMLGLDKVVYSSPQKVLVEQLGALPGVALLTGRGNYPCETYANQKADGCPFKSWEDACEVEKTCAFCTYQIARFNYNEADFGAVTLDLYLSDRSIQNDCNLHLVDESATLEAKLVSNAQYVIPKTVDISTHEIFISSVDSRLRVLEDVITVQRIALQGLQEEYSWKADKAKASRSKASHALLLTLRKEIVERQKIQSKAIQEQTKLTTIYGLLANKAPYNIKKEELDTYTFAPIFGKDVYRLVFNRDIVARIFASATPTTELLDIPYKAIAMDHPIPVDRRRIYYDPVAKVSGDTVDEALVEVAKRIEELHNRSHKKTLVHCNSYPNALKIYAALSQETKEITILQEGNHVRKESKDAFYRVAGEAIFLSVAYEEGLDLKEPEFNLNIITKVPYPKPPNADAFQGKRNALDGGLRYYTEPAIKIQQAAGRCTRTPTDYSETYILDLNFGGFFRNHKKLFKDWFKDALVMPKT